MKKQLHCWLTAIPLVAMASCTSTQQTTSSDSHTWKEAMHRYVNGEIRTGGDDTFVLLAAADTTAKRQTAADLQKVNEACVAAEHGNWKIMNLAINAIDDNGIRKLLRSELSDSGFPVSIGGKF